MAELTSYRNTVRDCGDHLEVEITSPQRATPVHMLCSKEHAHLLTKCRWRLNTGGYAEGSFDGKSWLFHRLALPGASGITTVDHINRDRLDNRVSNLRVVNKKSQNVNKLGRSSKEFPPGISYQASRNRFECTWTTSQGKDTQSFSCTALGYGGALKAAMRMRFAMMRNEIDTYRDAFSLEELSGVLAELALPPLSASPTGKELSLSLDVLDKAGYNVWNLLYSGRFAHYALRDDWKPADTFNRIHSMLGDAAMALSRRATIDKRTYDALEDAIERAILAIVPEYTAESTAKTVAEEVSRDSALPPKEALKQAVVEMKRADASPLSSAAKAEEIKKEALKEAVCAASEDRSGVISTLLAEARLSGKGDEAEKILNTAAAKLEKSVRPEEKKIKAPRKFVTVPSVEEWIEVALRHDPGSNECPDTLYAEYCIWCSRNRKGKPAGPLVFKQAVERAGYLKKAMPMFVDCKLVSKQ